MNAILNPGSAHLRGNALYPQKGEGVKMNRLTLRPWDSIDQILQWIGRCAAWRPKRSNSTAEESTAYAMTGGALVCAVLCGIVGFVLSDSSRNIDAIDGTILGALLGACIGIMFGSFVETVDRMIKDLLKSSDSE
jgi:cobalamin biosynthesis protein CobD/CbiB